jgi:hypothetical protein
MGYVFEELIRKFNEENNEEAGGVTSIQAHFDSAQCADPVIEGSGDYSVVEIREI